ncbi:protein phosphatase 2C domain-containing protein [Acidipropionibacterium timonense]|uniref:protein phosphatase 2C domain-containing protein n=1 Tax=Acidipropionibacterium timonense TaxID=2161818 RepID=UPI00102FF6D6
MSTPIDPDGATAEQGHTEPAGPEGIASPERLFVGARARTRSDLGLRTDVGLRHPTNQDFLSADVDADDCHLVLVVADGVSSTAGAERAAAIASRHVCAYLTAALAQGLPHGDDAVIRLFERAVDRANRAVLDPHTADPSQLGPDRATTDPTPSTDDPDGASAESRDHLEDDPHVAIGACTLAAAICSNDRLLVANIGDTRAYWFPGDGRAIRLSTDDSVAQAQIDLGMTREEAESGVGAHAITKWIGARATDITPRVVAYTPRSPGWLLLCSDGLWNHLPDPADLAAVLAGFVSRAPLVDGRPDPDAIAGMLVDHANACGGQDNVSVALWRADAVPARAAVDE